MHSWAIQSVQKEDTWKRTILQPRCLIGDLNHQFHTSQLCARGGKNVLAIVFKRTAKCSRQIKQRKRPSYDKGEINKKWGCNKNTITTHKCIISAWSEMPRIFQKHCSVSSSFVSKTVSFNKVTQTFVNCDRSEILWQRLRVPARNLAATKAKPQLSRKRGGQIKQDGIKECPPQGRK